MWIICEDKGWLAFYGPLRITMHQIKALCQVDVLARPDHLLIKLLYQTVSPSLFLFHLVIFVLCAGCRPGEFQCTKSKICIESTKICDLFPDCPDGSDEATCCKFQVFPIFWCQAICTVVNIWPTHFSYLIWMHCLHCLLRVQILGRLDHKFLPLVAVTRWWVRHMFPVNCSSKQNLAVL